MQHIFAASIFGQPDASLTDACLRTLTTQELSGIYGGVQSKGEEMCQLTEECERSQSRLAS